MSRYIDYDAIDYRHDKLHDKSSEFLDGVIYMAERIENAPSVEIVRCSECKKRYTEDCAMSYWDDDWGVWRIGELSDDWFCADGEREDE